jgi:V8-like Glu-specific endopeptidase
VRAVTRRWPAAATVALVLVVAACASVGNTPVSGSGEPDGIGRVASAEEAREVGTLFRAGSEDHFCSGTVVRGGTADLVVTAAHCVTSGPDRAPSTGLEYAPAYRQGAAPYGMWKAVRVTVDPRWTEHADPDLDVAFIQLAPRDGRRVTEVVAAQRIAFDTPGSGPVRLTGYPDGADDPLTCLGTMSRRADGQLRVACTGYAPGTSGTPWLTDFDPATRTWAVVGVIGGYQEGGDTDDVSYSPYFGPAIHHLYNRALHPT